MPRERDSRTLYPVEKKVLRALAAHVRTGKKRDRSGDLSINDIKKRLQMSAEGEAWKVERAINNLSRMQLVYKDDISRKVNITKRGLGIARRLGGRKREDAR